MFCALNSLTRRPASLSVRLALMVGGMLIIASGALAKKPPHAGDGDGGAIALNLMFRDASGDAIASDGDGPYFDGVDRVIAITDEGFRFDTDGTSKIVHPKMVRSAFFDFSETTAFLILPDFPDGSEAALAGVDARISNETDKDGNRLGTGWLKLRQMAPGETRYAEYTISFGFTNSVGDTEKWQLAYGRPPGADDDPATDWGLPVTVEAEDTDDDGSTDSWIVKGLAAGLRGAGFAYVGQDFMPFEMLVERQQP